MLRDPLIRIKPYDTNLMYVVGACEFVKLKGKKDKIKWEAGENGEGDVKLKGWIKHESLLQYACACGPSVYSDCYICFHVSNM